MVYSCCLVFALAVAVVQATAAAATSDFARLSKQPWLETTPPPPFLLFQEQCALVVEPTHVDSSAMSATTKMQLQRRRRRKSMVRSNPKASMAITTTFKDASTTIETATKATRATDHVIKTLLTNVSMDTTISTTEYNRIQDDDNNNDDAEKKLVLILIWLATGYAILLTPVGLLLLLEWAVRYIIEKIQYRRRERIIRDIQNYRNMKRPWLDDEQLQAILHKKTIEKEDDDDDDTTVREPSPCQATDFAVVVALTDDDGGDMSAEHDVRMCQQLQPSRLDQPKFHETFNDSTDKEDELTDSMTDDETADESEEETETETMTDELTKTTVAVSDCTGSSHMPMAEPCPETPESAPRHTPHFKPKGMTSLELALLKTRLERSLGYKKTGVEKGNVFLPLDAMPKSAPPSPAKTDFDDKSVSSPDWVLSLIDESDHQDDEDGALDVTAAITELTTKRRRRRRRRHTCGASSSNDPSTLRIVIAASQPIEEAFTLQLPNEPTNVPMDEPDCMPLLTAEVSPLPLTKPMRARDTKPQSLSLLEWATFKPNLEAVLCTMVVQLKNGGGLVPTQLKQSVLPSEQAPVPQTESETTLSSGGNHLQSCIAVHESALDENVDLDVLLASTGKRRRRRRRRQNIDGAAPMKPHESRITIESFPSSSNFGMVIEEAPVLTNGDERDSACIESLPMPLPLAQPTDTPRESKPKHFSSLKWASFKPELEKILKSPPKEMINKDMLLTVNGNEPSATSTSIVEGSTMPLLNPSMVQDDNQSLDNPTIEVVKKRNRRRRGRKHAN